MKVIIVILLFVIIPVIPISYGWEFGGFVLGDVFEYDICDKYTLDANTALRSKCYGISIHVIDEFEMNFGYVWLLYVEVDNGENGELIRDIMIVDESFNVNSLYHKYIGDSIGNTIFWMPSHAGITDISLDLGNTVYGGPGMFDEMVITDFSRKDTSIQYTLSSDSGDFIILRDDLYLPLSIDIDTDTLAFNAQLNSMYNELEFGFVETDDLYFDVDISPTNIYNETDVDISSDDIPKNDVPEISVIAPDDIPKNDVPEISVITSDDIPKNDVPEISVITSDDIPKNDDLFVKLYDNILSFFESLF